MTKRKDERRELLKEDEFLSTLERIAQYIQENTKQVFIWTGAVLVGLAAFFGFLSYQETQRERAAVALYQAEKILATDLENAKSELKFDSEREKIEAALVELDKVIANESGAAKYQAIVYKIRCKIDLGQRDGLEDLYGQLAKSHGEFKLFGMMGLADFYAAQQKYEDALDQYNRVMNSADTRATDLVHYRKALCYQKMGKVDEAKIELNDIISAYEGAEVGQKPLIHTKAQQLLTEIESKEPPTQEGG